LPNRSKHFPGRLLKMRQHRNTVHTFEHNSGAPAQGDKFMRLRNPQACAMDGPGNQKLPLGSLMGDPRMKQLKDSSCSPCTHIGRKPAAENLGLLKPFNTITGGPPLRFGVQM